MTSGLRLAALALIPSRQKANSIIFLLSICSLISLKSGVAHSQNLAVLPNDSASKEVLRIELKGDTLSIRAKQISWEKLLTMLETKTQVSIKGARPKGLIASLFIPAQPVTGTLRELFNSRTDYVLQFSDQQKTGPSAPKTIWLLSSDGENALQTAQLETIKAEDKPYFLTKSDKTTVSTRPLQISSEDGRVNALIDKAKGEENPELRLQALSKLVDNAQMDKSTLIQALDTAFEDKDARIREFAVENFAKERGPEITRQLRDALHDHDPGVRIKAVENIALSGEGIALLEEARANPDEMIQAIAEERLKQAEN